MTRRPGGPARPVATVGRLIAPLALALSVHPLSAQPEHALVESTRLAPHDAALFFAVDDASELRRGPVGGFALALIDGVAGFGHTFEAWDRLAADLKWKPDEAFDALLGRRVVFAAKRDPAQSAGIGPWVLISEVTAPTAKRLADQLKPMPRQLFAGTPVLSVEGGRFQIGLMKQPAGDRGGADSYLLMLADGSEGGGAILQQSLRDAQGRQHRGLSGTPQAELLRLVAPDARALFFADFALFESSVEGAVEVGASEVRVDLAPASSKGWLVGGAWPIAEGVRIQSAIRAPEFEAAARRQAARRASAWNPQAFEALSQDALFASLEGNATVDDAPWRETFPRIAAALGISPDLPARARLTGRLASLLLVSANGMMDAAVALETDDVRALPPLADGEMAKLSSTLFSRAGPRATDTPGTAVPDASRYDYAGLAPAATRRLDLSSMVGPALNAAWDNGAVAYWRFTEQTPLHAPEVGTLREGSQPGWWITGLGPGAVARLAEADLVAPPSWPRVDWLAMLSARPRAVLERLESRGVPTVRLLEPARWVTRVTWYSMLAPTQGDILAGGRVELSPPPGKRAAPEPGAPAQK